MLNASVLESDQLHKDQLVAHYSSARLFMLLLLFSPAERTETRRKGRNTYRGAGTGGYDAKQVSTSIAVTPVYKRNSSESRNSADTQG